MQTPPNFPKVRLMQRAQIGARLERTVCDSKTKFNDKWKIPFTALTRGSLLRGFFSYPSRRVTQVYM